MIVSNTLNEQTKIRSAVTLEQYVKSFGGEITECQVFGVDDVDNRNIDLCRDIWTLEQRNYTLRYLSEAQIEFENETGMLFGTTWITGNLLDTGNDRLTDIQTYRGRNHYNRGYSNPAYMTKWNNVVAVGKLVKTLLETDIVVDKTNDPHVITLTIDPLVVLDFNYIRMFESGQEIELNPSSISLSGDTLSIEIPRCRTVKYTLRNTPPEGLVYTDLDNFIDAVDVYYYATVNEDSLVVRKSNCTCTPTTISSCLEIVTTGITTVRAVSSCYPTNCLCSGSDLVAGFYYEAGEAVPNQQQIDAIIRLAHTKMGSSPCGCDPINNVWERDREEPEGFIPEERLACKFGTSQGAWFAWKQAQSMKKIKLGSTS